MLKRFRPYISYLRPVRGTLTAAIVAGVIYGAANGAGLPWMVHSVFPKVFGAKVAPMGVWAILAIAMWLPIVFTIRGIAGYLNSYLIQVAGVKILEALRL